MSETAQDRLVAELRRSSVGRPTIPKESLDASSIQWSAGLDAKIPLILGALRTDMVRTVFAVLLGAGAACAGGLAQTLGWLDRDRARFLGALGGGLVAWVAVGLPLPGRVPFLEVKTPVGFHCRGSKRNDRLKGAFEGFMARFSPTPWIRSGEWCTVLPFLWTENKAGGLQYERAWVRNPNDQEHLACDWVFPPGGFDPERPVVIFFPGLGPAVHWKENGGFVANAAWHVTAKCNMTAVVAVPRGTMDTEVKERVGHGARSYDVREVVLLAERAMRAARCEKTDANVPLPLVACGFSMGAIMVSNYVGCFGADCRLAGVVHFSGLYDGVLNQKFDYGNKTWQTYLAYGLKANFMGGRIGRIAARRGVDMKKVMSRQVESCGDFDEEFTAVLGGYEDGATGYYRDFSLAHNDKWKNVKVPVLAICARDDPITHCDSLHVQEFAAGNENMLFLVTERGGHVGWPWGMMPWRRGFDFMSEGVALFVEALLSNG